MKICVNKQVKPNRDEIISKIRAIHGIDATKEVNEMIENEKIRQITGFIPKRNQ